MLIQLWLLIARVRKEGRIKYRWTIRFLSTGRVQARMKSDPPNWPSHQNSSIFCPLFVILRKKTCKKLVKELAFLPRTQANSIPPFDRTMHFLAILLHATWNRLSSPECRLWMAQTLRWKLQAGTNPKIHPQAPSQTLCWTMSHWVAYSKCWSAWKDHFNRSYWYLWKSSLYAKLWHLPASFVSQHSRSIYIVFGIKNRYSKGILVKCDLCNSFLCLEHPRQLLCASFSRGFLIYLHSNLLFQFLHSILNL